MPGRGAARVLPNEHSTWHGVVFAIYCRGPAAGAAPRPTPARWCFARLPQIDSTPAHHALPRRKSERALEAFCVGRPYLGIDYARRPVAVERAEHLLGGDAAHIGARF